jgi:hypothetical protein
MDTAPVEVLANGLDTVSPVDDQSVIIMDYQLAELAGEL